MSTRDLVLERANELPYKAFTSSDFLDLEAYKNISKALETLQKSGDLLRARRGVYYLPRKNRKFGFIEPPDIDEVAKAIARQYNLSIVPSSNHALNMVGISTQVPSGYSYITDGPYNEYMVGNIPIRFKHATKKEINGLRFKNLVAIQAIKSLGRCNITKDVETKISRFLDEDDKQELRQNKIKITSWIYDLLRRCIDNGEINNLSCK